MRPQVGVELQSDFEVANVAGDGFGGYDVQETKRGIVEEEEEWDDCLANEKEGDENFAESIDEQTTVGPVDNAITDDSRRRIDRIDDQVSNTGLKTVRSLVNGGLAMLAFGALSPVGQLLKHLDNLKEEDEGSERTEDDDDV